MKTIKVKRIIIEEWRGKNIDVFFNDDITKISAKNEVGKTTLIHAWNWVFSSYTSSTSTKNEELFDNRKPLTHETPIAKVLLHITIDGVKHTIERRAKAKFTRPSGAVEYVKANTDEYTIIVDGFTLPAKEFAQWVDDNICEYALIQFLLDGSFFTTLAENDRAKARKALGKVIGEVSMDDFMGDYTLIKPLLSIATAEQIITSRNEERRNLETELTTTTALLDNERKKDVSLSQAELEGIEEELKSIDKNIADIDAKLVANIEGADVVDTLTKRLIATTQEYTMSSANYEQEYNDTLRSLRQDYDAEKLRVDNLKLERKYQERRIKVLEEEKKRLQDKEKDLQAYYDEQMAQLSKLRSTTDGNVCPTCGTSFANVQEKCEKTLYDIEITSKSIIKCEKFLEEQRSELPIIEDNSESMLAEVKKHEDAYVPFSHTFKGKALDSIIKGLRSDLDKYEVKDNSALVATRASLQSRRDELLFKKASYGVSESEKSRVMALEDSRRAIANNIVHLEGIVAKAKEYIEERAQIISERVNSKLDGYKVVMYSTQKDGTKVPDCVVTDNKGVKFAILSNSARIRANLQMQELFCSALGVRMPIWIDECSIFDDEHLPRPRGQAIYLYAGNSDNLVVE